MDANFKGTHIWNDEDSRLVKKFCHKNNISENVAEKIIANNRSLGLAPQGKTNQSMEIFKAVANFVMWAPLLLTALYFLELFPIKVVLIKATSIIYGISLLMGFLVILVIEFGINQVPGMNLTFARVKMALKFQKRKAQIKRISMLIIDIIFSLVLIFHFGYSITGSVILIVRLIIAYNLYKLHGSTITAMHNDST